MNDKIIDLGIPKCDNCEKPIITFPGMDSPAGATFFLESGESITMCYMCLGELGEKGEKFKPKGKKLKKLWK